METGVSLLRSRKRHWRFRLVRKSLSSDTPVSIIVFRQQRNLSGSGADDVADAAHARSPSSMRERNSRLAASISSAAMMAETME